MILTTTQHVKQEDANKFRCKVPGCTKLFKSTEFWHKHVEKRHDEWLAGIRNDFELVNTYVLDPAHIAPSRSDANSNGHFPIGNGGQPTGTPRGFSLGGHIPFPVTGMPNQVTPTGFAPPGVFTAGMTGWGPPGSATNPVPGMVGGVGPVRSHGGRYQNGGYRAGNPYARPDGRGRQPSFSAAARGLDPVGPPPGRQIRSYEDLDAAGGEKEAAAELDY